MILALEQDDTERYLFSSEGSNGAGKNEFVFQFTCLQPHLYIKIHAPCTHIFRLPSKPKINDNPNTFILLRLYNQLNKTK